MANAFASGWAGALTGGKADVKGPVRVDGAFGLWLGPGSNRRPIAFQAIARTN